MSEEGGLGALLGAYNSDSDVEDQKSAGSLYINLMLIMISVLHLQLKLSTNTP
jgi:hypothetical protein